MNIILLNSSRGQTRSLPITWPNLIILSMLLFLMPVALGVGSYFLGAWLKPPILSSGIVDQWQESLDQQRQGVRDFTNDAEGQLAALTVKMAQMQARLLRLDALGEHISELA